jgi:hypothetical protein
MRHRHPGHRHCKNNWQSGAATVHNNRNLKHAARFAHTLSPGCAVPVLWHMLQSHSEAAAAQAAEQPVECDISHPGDQVLVHRLGNNQHRFSVRCVPVLPQMRQPSSKHYTRHAMAATQNNSHTSTQRLLLPPPPANSHASTSHALQAA